MRTLTASDRQSLIKLASGLPKGDETRKAILAGLKKTAYTEKGGLGLRTVVSDIATAKYSIQSSPRASLIVYVEFEDGSLNEDMNVHLEKDGLSAMDADGNDVSSSKVPVTALLKMSDADITRYLLKWLPDASASSKFTVSNNGF